MKKPIRLGLVFFFFVALHNQLQAQTGVSSCGWQPADEAAQTRNPFLMQMKRIAKRRSENLSLYNRTEDADSLYTLPVVVHVITTGDAIGSADNPTDAAITGMIGSLNDAWRKNGVSYGGVDMKMQFQLATRSPQCGSTTGIVRVSGAGIANYVTGGIAIDTYSGSADEWKVKALSRWPNTDYIISGSLIK